MIRVVLDTNVIVSALLKPEGLESTVFVLALRSQMLLCISEPVFAEYDDVLRRPRLKLKPAEIDATLTAIRERPHLVEPKQRLSISKHESDNRFLECAETARADYLINGNTRHFPAVHATATILSARQFLEILATA